MEEQYYDPPIDVSWFQAELDLMCRDAGCALRIVWAPRLTIARVVRPDGTIRKYAKYPILFGDFRVYTKGHYFVRFVAPFDPFKKASGKMNMITVGYQKQGDLIPPGILQSDIALPDMVTVNPSIHQFVIERKLPDETAKRYWEEKAILAKNKLGLDLFGPFPPEGVWEWFDYIHQHPPASPPNPSCCELAADHGVMCVGLYRDPDLEDLARVRQSVKTWVERPKYIYPDLAAVAAGVVRTKEILADKESALTAILQETREGQKLDDIAHARSRVVIGTNPPRHRREY